MLVAVRFAGHWPANWMAANTQ